MLLFLTAGLMLIVYTGDFLLGSILKGITDTTGLSQLLKGAGWSIVYGMAGLTMIIGLGWLLTKRRPK
jgi:hypothetical protein